MAMTGVADLKMMRRVDDHLRGGNKIRQRSNFKRGNNVNISFPFLIILILINKI